MAWAIPSFDDGASVLIVAPELTGTVEAVMQRDGVVFYLVNYLDTQDNPARQWFKQAELSSGA